MIKQYLHRFSLLLIIFITTCISCTSAQAKLKVNAVAPAFTATDINGKKLSLEQLKGKIVVMNFWFIQCGPCRKEMPLLNALVEKYKNNSEIVFISFAMNEADELKTFFEKNIFSYQTVPTAEKIAKSYKVVFFPTNLVVDKSGKIVFNQSGYSDRIETNLEKAIETALHQ